MVPPEQMETCLWCFMPPDGPSTPFGTAELVLIDSLRVAILLGIVAMIALTVPAIRHTRSLGQRVRMLGQIPLAVVVATVQLEHFGDYTSWRLLVALFGVWFAAYGMWLFLAYERPGSGERQARRGAARAARRERERSALSRLRRRPFVR